MLQEFAKNDASYHQNRDLEMSPGLAVVTSMTNDIGVLD